MVAVIKGHNQSVINCKCFVYITATICVCMRSLYCCIRIFKVFTKVNLPMILRHTILKFLSASGGLPPDPCRWVHLPPQHPCLRYLPTSLNMYTVVLIWTLLLCGHIFTVCFIILPLMLLKRSDWIKFNHKASYSTVFLPSCKFFCLNCYMYSQWHM